MDMLQPFLISRKDLAALMREKEKVVFPGNQKGIKQLVTSQKTMQQHCGGELWVNIMWRSWLRPDPLRVWLQR
jgi:hypothetical protein